MTTQTIVNGLDSGRLGQTMKAVRSQPEIGRFRFRAHNRWIGGAHCQTTIRDFRAPGEEDASHSQAFELHGDEPDMLLGQDHGPNATEALLHALAACLNTTFIFHATAKGIPIEELELELEGDINLNGFLGLRGDVRNGYEQIRVTFRVKADAPLEKIQELCELAQQRSPVFDIVTHPVPVEVTCQKK